MDVYEMKKFKKNFLSKWPDIDELYNLHRRLTAVEDHLETMHEEEEPIEPCKHMDLTRSYYTRKSSGNPVYKCAMEECKFEIDILV
jgi:hypothetical protein